MTGLLQELNQAWRGLWRQPGFFIATTATLAVGIGAATLLAVVLRAALADPTSRLDEARSVGRIYASSRALGVDRSPLSLADFEVLTGAAAFESIAAYRVRGEAGAPQARAAVRSIGEVSEEFFRVLRARAAAGRLPDAHDFSQGTPVAVLSERAWRALGSRDPIGEASIALDGTRRIVVGVLPAEFGFSTFGIDADAWLPMARRGDGTSGAVSVIGRLKPGRGWVAAGQELAVLATAARVQDAWTWRAIPLRDDVRQRERGGVAVALVPALTVLLIACLNVGCMALARGMAREKELHVRGALGATRGRIVGQVMTEHALLAAVGGAMGLAAAMWGLRATASTLVHLGPAFDGISAPDSALLLGAIGFSSLASVLSGALPAAWIVRRDIASSLRGDSLSRRVRVAGYGPRDLIVFAELGLAVVLVVTSAMWLRLFDAIARVTPAYAAHEVVAASVQSPLADQAMERVAALPGVVGVVHVSHVPGTREASAIAQVRTAEGRTTGATIVRVGRSFFSTIGLPLIRGRPFDAAETSHAGVAVVGQAAAAALWPGGEPLGARISIEMRSGSTAAQVVGVSRDSLDAGRLTRAGIFAAEIYVPFDPDVGDVSVLLARAVDAHGAIRSIAAAAKMAGSDWVPDAHVVADRIGVGPRDGDVLARLIAALGLVALALAAAGTFGVVGQSVHERTGEFGVRMALGASRGSVMRLVLAREAKLIAAAVLSGALGTLAVSRAAWAALAAFSGTDPAMWIGVCALCAGAAGAAVLVAVHRITRVDPMTVLRRT